MSTLLFFWLFFFLILNGSTLQPLYLSTLLPYYNFSLLPLYFANLPPLIPFTLLPCHPFTLPFFSSTDLLINPVALPFYSPIDASSLIPLFFWTCTLLLFCFLAVRSFYPSIIVLCPLIFLPVHFSMLLFSTSTSF